jgi:aminomethyltransferase
MAWVASLGSRPVVELAGPDARRFANGMFTHNVRDLPVGGVQRSAMADDRGRIVGLMELLALADDRFLLVLEGMSAADFAERYDKYIVFDDVTVIPHAGLELRTVQGPGAAARLAEAGVPVPETDRWVAHGDGWVWSHDRGGQGYDVLGTGSLPAVDPDGAERAEWLRVRAGLVRFPDDIAAPALPHEHGLRERVLHFSKGCYLGQEQIHRIEVMGKPRRSLAVVRVPAGADEGAAVVFEAKKVGVLTSVVPHPDGGCLGLAVLRKPADEPGAELTVDGHTAHVVPPVHPPVA